ncbi:hypothetical protein ACI6Q2_02475 [Chitinophagaceae bacterium LWZ2-11]
MLNIACSLTLMSLFFINNSVAVSNSIRTDRHLITDTLPNSASKINDDSLRRTIQPLLKNNTSLDKAKKKKLSNNLM